MNKPKYYLRVSPPSNYRYNDFYYDITSDSTWKMTLNYIEQELDDHYCNNNGSLLGIKFSIEIVAELPEGVEYNE